MRRNLKSYAGILTLSAILGIGAIASPANVKAATEHWNDAAQTGGYTWTKYKNNWDTISQNLENVSLTPGVDETELNFAWYSHTPDKPMVRISTDKDMKNAVEFTGNQTVTDVENYYSNKVTVTGLTANTKYYYQVNQNGEWQTTKTYTTKSFSDFSFLYVGDPQIGACTGQTSTDKSLEGSLEGSLAARNDAYNWNNVLNDALKDHPDVSFMVSAGDQVNNSKGSEVEYAGYLSANALTSLPVATTIGNHDSGSVKYSNHFNNPNTFDEAEAAYTAGRTAAGTDYYYTYGDVLFIVLDTNNYNCATHKNVIKKAVDENKDAKWRVVMFHQDIYGSGKDHSDSDGMVLRTQLTPIMDEFDIDVVLQGHDHTYSRTYQLTSDGQEHAAYTKNANNDDYQEDNLCYDITSDVVDGTINNPEGTVYFEANSATGSKFYNLIATQQDYIAERSQEWNPTYSVISVTDNTFSVTTYDSATRKQLKGSSTYTIVKGEEQNQDVNNTSDNNTAQQNTNSSAQQTQNTTVAKPAKETVKKVTSTKAKTAKITWKKDTSVTGYQIAYTYKKGFKTNVKYKDIKKNTKTSVTLKNLKKGKTLFVKVRSYNTVNGQKVYGSYSTVKKVKIK